MTTRLTDEQVAAGPYRIIERGGKYIPQKWDAYDHGWFSLFWRKARRLEEAECWLAAYCRRSDVDHVEDGRVVRVWGTK
jgi:hypothetical protein